MDSTHMGDEDLWHQAPHTSLLSAFHGPLDTQFFGPKRFTLCSLYSVTALLIIQVGSKLEGRLQLTSV